VRDYEDNPFAGIERPEDLPFGTPDDQVHAHVDGSAYTGRKLAALRAYATQLPAESPFFAPQSLDWLTGEYYVLAKGDQGPGHGPHGWEDDLFAGL
jgi:N-acetyl-1-D-myo-inositol-2-amino-2-deoxy-alpha-D-glucopyranoside deacetylase